MNAPSVERRKRRSKEKFTALRYQLEATQNSGRLEAVALTDRAGLVVVGAGDEGVCEELAAVAPLMATNWCRAPGMPLLVGADVSVRPLRNGTSELYLASSGGTIARDAVLLQSIRGLERILKMQ